MMCRVHEKQYKSEERKRTAKERGRERERERKINLAQYNHLFSMTSIVFIRSFNLKNTPLEV